jgi:hypothetical protein
VDPADARGDHWHAFRQRFEHDERCPLGSRGNHEYVEVADESSRIPHRAQKRDVALEIESRCLCLQCAAKRSITDHEKASSGMERSDTGYSVEKEVNPFLGKKPSHYANARPAAWTSQGLMHPLHRR